MLIQTQLWAQGNIQERRLTGLGSKEVGHGIVLCHRFAFLRINLKNFKYTGIKDLKAREQGPNGTNQLNKTKNLLSLCGKHSLGLLPPPSALTWRLCYCPQPWGHLYFQTFPWCLSAAWQGVWSLHSGWTSSAPARVQEPDSPLWPAAAPLTSWVLRWCSEWRCTYS